MRSRHILTVIAFGLLAASQAAAANPAIAWRTTDWDGAERTYGVYVPAERLNPAPVVFLLHGGGGSARTTWQQEHGRSWRALADENGFVLVLPEGRPDPDSPDAHHWNDCRTGHANEATATNEDDVGFLCRLIDTVEDTVAVDRSRVYATGASNGGMMCYRLAIEAGDRFAAVAALIANLPDPSECAGTPPPIPIMIMNGTEDPLMPFLGGCVATDRCDRGRVMSTAETVAFWVGVNRASTEPIVERLPNRAWFDGSRVTVYTYRGERGGADVVYYEVTGGGHAVPGFETPSPLRRALAGSKNRDIDGPTEIWSFFRSCARDAFAPTARRETVCDG